MAAGSWTLTSELFERGDPSFVQELRKVHDPERLGSFAAVWLADKRPFARNAIFEYLSLPLNCYRHEPLVKRLFKLAEAAKDDEVMGVFLVAFDRLIRRVRRKVENKKSKLVEDRASAEALAREWKGLGFSNEKIIEFRSDFWVSASKSEFALKSKNDRMPVPYQRDKAKAYPLNDEIRRFYEKHFLLFSLMTRRYLRRRAWRYFRLLGKSDPARYVRAAAQFLARYRDGDVETADNLIDNWGLIHALFYGSPALSRPAKGCKIDSDKTVSDLAFAPWFEPEWVSQPDLLLDLLLNAQCRTVRMFGLRMLQSHGMDWLRHRPTATILNMIDHVDPAVSQLGFELLEHSPDLSAIPVEDWLRRLESDDFEKLTQLSNFLSKHLDPARVSLDRAVDFAVNRSRPIAALGFRLLKEKAIAATEIHSLLKLLEADCDSIRPEMTNWLKTRLVERASPVPSSWLIEFLDSKHADVRQVGWTWFRGAPWENETALWQKCMESPYDDVRTGISDLLATIVNQMDSNSLQYLWATVLCSIRRGSRQKPGVVSNIVQRISKNPSEAPALLPLLAIAVRSLRGPEFRAGLAGVVQLSETKPELLPLIRQQFSELTF